MSRIQEVLANKNKIEKARKARRRNEMKLLKERSQFKAKLYELLQGIEVCLEDKNVDAIVINVPDDRLATFGTAIYSDEMVGYSVEQVRGNPNEFLIKRKYITL